jgi:hypothetical protein
MELHRELQSLRSDLMTKYQQGSWSELSSLLETVARVSEVEGRRELCLRAQTLRELMGTRAGGRESPGDRMSQVFEEMMSHLSHLQWLSSR